MNRSTTLVYFFYQWWVSKESKPMIYSQYITIWRIPGFMPSIAPIAYQYKLKSQVKNKRGGKTATPKTDTSDVSFSVSSLPDVSSSLLRTTDRHRHGVGSHQRDLHQGNVQQDVMAKRVLAMRTVRQISSLWCYTRNNTLPHVLHVLLSLIHIWRCRRIERCRSRWSPYH